MGVAAGATMLLLAVPAGAQYTTSPILVSENSEGELSKRFSPGEELVIEGFFFPENADYLVEFEQNPTTELARVTTDSLGTFAAPAEIPAIAENGNATVRARPVSGQGPTATLGLIIAGAAEDVTDDADDTGTTAEVSLPTTGSDIALFGAYGAALLAAGAALVAYARRRGRRTPSPDVDPWVSRVSDEAWAAFEAELAADARGEQDHPDWPTAAPLTTVLRRERP